MKTKRKPEPAVRLLPRDDLLRVLRDTTQVLNGDPKASAVINHFTNAAAYHVLNARGLSALWGGAMAAQLGNDPKAALEIEECFPQVLAALVPAGMAARAMKFRREARLGELVERQIE